jgi:HD-GYP domain-containing protein (c-di-GMP phosphodiesterase class II)
MKQIVYLDKLKKQREFLVSSWESSHCIDMIECQNEAQAIAKIKESDDTEKILFIKDESDSIDFSDFFHSVFGEDENIKVILKSNNKELISIIKELATELYIIEKPFDTEEMKSLFEKLKIPLLSEFIDGYQRIRIFSFLKYQKAISDVYILLGNNKFVKIINIGEENSVDILKKYHKKEVKYLYVKIDNLSVYLERSSEILLSAFANKPKDPKELQQLHRLSIENVTASLLALGISPIVIELTKVTMNSVMASIEEIKDLWPYILRSLKEGSFNSNHSLAISTLSCGIINKMTWKSEFTIRKLVTASVLHDITLSSDRIALIHDKDDIEFQGLTSKEKSEFYDHPQRAVDFLKRFSGIPANVDSIILEHHERPGGKGFPRHLDSMSISPLGAIHIIAEVFYHKAYTKEFSKDCKEEIFEEMKEEYTVGNYKEPFKGLQSLFE